MKDVHESEIFKLLDKKGNIFSKCQSNLSKTGVDLAPYLEDTFKIIARIFKDPLTNRAIEAVHNKTLRLYYTPAADRLPVYYPFIKARKNGVPTISVDLSNYVSVSTDKITEETTVKIDNKKLYSMMVSGYLYLTLFYNRDSVMSPTLMALLSNIWAQLFCKILIQKVGLSTNRDRLDAFMYFAQKYFLLNICEYPEQSAENMALMQFQNRDVNPTAKSISEACSARGIEMYSDLITFCNTLFNADITGLRGMRLSGSNDGMTFDYFVRQYIMMYYAPSGLSLASLPHFVWMIIAANNYAYIFNDAVIEKCCTKDFPKIMSEIYRLI